MGCLLYWTATGADSKWVFLGLQWVPQGLARRLCTPGAPLGPRGRGHGPPRACSTDKSPPPSLSTHARVSQSAPHPCVGWALGTMCSGRPRGGGGGGGDPRPRTKEPTVILPTFVLPLREAKKEISRECPTRCLLPL